MDDPKVPGSLEELAQWHERRAEDWRVARDPGMQRLHEEAVRLCRGGA